MHCSAGKDRTGVLCALVLMLVGVGDEEVAEEYALSEQGLGPIREEIVEGLMGMEALEGDREGVERMVGCRRESMIAVIEMVRRVYGGVEGYLRERFGLGDEDLRGIRENLTRDESGD